MQKRRKDNEQTSTPEFRDLSGEDINHPVYSLAGPATTHGYDVPSDTPEALVQFAAIAESVDAALSGESEYLVLLNPFVVYNPDHIVSIHSETFGSADPQHAMETARRKTGFNLSGDHPLGGRTGKS